MTRLSTVLLVLSLLVVAGCSSQVTRPEVAGEALPVARTLQDFTVEMSPGAKATLADNVKFDINALQVTLQRTLDGKGLLSPVGDYRLKVVVNSIRVRSTFNAVMWGFMAGNDHLRGDVTVLDLAGREVYSFEVSASYALGGLGGGQDASRMNWLYEEFSEMVAGELLGKQNE